MRIPTLQRLLLVVVMLFGAATANDCRADIIYEFLSPPIESNGTPLNQNGHTLQGTISVASIPGSGVLQASDITALSLTVFAPDNSEVWTNTLAEFDSLTFDHVGIDANRIYLTSNSSATFWLYNTTTVDWYLLRNSPFVNGGDFWGRAGADLWNFSGTRNGEATIATLQSIPEPSGFLPLLLSCALLRKRYRRPGF